MMQWSLAILLCASQARAEPQPLVLEQDQPLRGIVQLALGGQHTCGRRADGTVLCWGDGDQGQRGDGAMGTSPEPVVTRRFAKLIELAAGSLHTCARTTAGVWCWGYNYTYQLGVGDATRADASGSGGTRLRPQATTRFGKPAAFALGDVSYAIDAKGAVTCVGHSNFCGWDKATSPVVDMPPVTTAAVGDGHACAVTREHEVYCWGRTDWGQGGSGLDHTDQGPTKVDGLTGIVQVAVGGAHSCARTAGGDVYCWGLDDRGQLGDGTTTQRNRPIKAPVAHVVQLAAGGFITCARFADATAACWGANPGGDQLQPTKLPFRNVLEVAVGGLHACVRLADDTVRCWGANSNGQLGDGTTTDRATPVTVLAR